MQLDEVDLKMVVVAQSGLREECEVGDSQEESLAENENWIM